MLSYLLSQAAEVTNIPNSTASNRARLLSMVNRAARELYDLNDLPNSLWEQYFCVDSSLGQVTLPWYVGQIRGVRVMGIKITLHDLRPRYHSSPWRQQYLEFRVKGLTPLSAALSTSSQLTATLGTAEAEVVNINIVGATATNAYATETISIAAGSLAGTTTKQFLANDITAITSITKDTTTLSDVVITAATGGATVATIPARFEAARNILLQVHDSYDATSTLAGSDDNVEVLYKKLFVPFYQDFDTFIVPELEDAIIWKLREHWYSLAKDEFAVSQAQAAAAKCNLIIAGVTSNQTSQVELVIGRSADTMSLRSVLPLYRQ